MIFFEKWIRRRELLLETYPSRSQKSIVEMMFNENTEYEILITEDGSPTIREKGTHEWMHHPRGAWSETKYIYGKAIEIWLTKIPYSSCAFVKHNIFSLGLGLGYNEILIPFMFQQLKADFPWQVQTWESQDILRTNWLNYLDHMNQNSFYQSLYDQVFSITTKESPNVDLKEIIKNKIKNNDWILHHSLSEPFSESTQRTSLVLFDAFSGKSQPELWSESFLENFIDHFFLEKGVFATYACTGTLKRVLKKKKFQLIPTEGFGGKRQSTIAIRMG